MGGQASKASQTRVVQTRLRQLDADGGGQLDVRRARALLVQCRDIDGVDASACDRAAQTLTEALDEGAATLPTAAVVNRPAVRAMLLDAGADIPDLLYSCPGTARNRHRRLQGAAAELLLRRSSEATMKRHLNLLARYCGEGAGGGAGDNDGGAGVAGSRRHHDPDVVVMDQPIQPPPLRHVERPRPGSVSMEAWAQEGPGAFAADGYGDVDGDVDGDGSSTAMMLDIPRRGSHSGVGRRESGLSTGTVLTQEEYARTLRQDAGVPAGTFVEDEEEYASSDDGGHHPHVSEHERHAIVSEVDRAARTMGGSGRSPPPPSDGGSREPTRTRANPFGNPSATPPPASAAAGEQAAAGAAAAAPASATLGPRSSGFAALGRGDISITSVPVRARPATPVVRTRSPYLLNREAAAAAAAMPGREASRERGGGGAAVRSGSAAAPDRGPMVEPGSKLHPDEAAFVARKRAAGFKAAERSRQPRKTTKPRTPRMYKETKASRLRRAQGGLLNSGEMRTNLLKTWIAEADKHIHNGAELAPHGNTPHAMSLPHNTAPVSQHPPVGRAGGRKQQQQQAPPPAANAHQPTGFRGADTRGPPRKLRAAPAPTGGMRSRLAAEQEKEKARDTTAAVPQQLRRKGSRQEQPGATAARKARGGGLGRARESPFEVLLEPVTDDVGGAAMLRKSIRSQAMSSSTSSVSHASTRQSRASHVLGPPVLANVLRGHKQVSPLPSYVIPSHPPLNLCIPNQTPHPRTVPSTHPDTTLDTKRVVSLFRTCKAVSGGSARVGNLLAWKSFGCVRVCVRACVRACGQHRPVPPPQPLDNTPPMCGAVLPTLPPIVTWHLFSSSNKRRKHFLCACTL